MQIDKLKSQKFVFMLVENGDFDEKTYRIVTEDEMNDSLADYKKHRPVGVQPKKIEPRKNPFMDAVNVDRKSAELDEAPPLSLLRLVALREVISLPIRSSLSTDTSKEDSTKILSLILPSLKTLLITTPDLAIRKLAVEYIDRLSSLNEISFT